MDVLRDIARRLAAGSAGRSEADIQSDIRQFLLTAPLELGQDDVIDVSLETHAGNGRRIDVEAGCAVIEVKKSLNSKTVYDAAVAQLSCYVQQRSETRAQRYVGILTDGQRWVLLHLVSGHLEEVSRFHLPSEKATAQLSGWLEVILATTDKVAPTPSQIVRRLGSDSPAAQLDLADLRALYEVCRTDPEVQLKRELWARLLLAALGTNFEESDELFVLHTYLVLIAELIAHEAMGLAVGDAAVDARALLEGQRFATAGLHGVVEPDFFDWPAMTTEGSRIIVAIARRLSRFEWQNVDRDVLKALYESVIDADTRRRLGEYYTPDWLAQKLVDSHFAEPLHDRLLDPACGSGTFLFWTVKRVLDACDQAGIANRDALESVIGRVQGMDLHPVAVTLARVTYLLALTPDRLADRGELTIPVFLGDSVRWGVDDVTLSERGMTVRTSNELELIEDELHFPEGVLEEPARFDRLVADLANKASKRKRGSKPPSINGLLNRHKVAGDDDRAALETAFRKLCRLHDVGRDHVWSYYIRNRARPLSFTRQEGRADVLVGNPPWLPFRSMPTKLQQTYRLLATERGLWAGGKVATHQDLSDLFVARSVEQYLKPGGRFAFVMPYAALSRRQFAGFRTGEWSTASTFGVQFGLAEEYARVKPPLFPVPACVVTGRAAPPAIALTPNAVSWTGRVPHHHVDWAVASEHLSSHDDAIAAASDVSASPYRSSFRQGAVLVPRMLLAVERLESGPIGIAAGSVRVRSARSANEKKPWKGLQALEHVVEEEFVRPMHLGATIVAYRLRQPSWTVVPLIESELPRVADERLDEYPGLAAWWREANDVWDMNRSPSSDLTLLEQIDYQSKLSRQVPAAEHRVVYTKSGQHLAACRVDDPAAIIDHTLYWAPTVSVDEGRYICAVLNSGPLATAVRALQSRGQHNPRHFDMHVFAVPFPLYDAEDPLHRSLVSLASKAEATADGVELDVSWQFQKARRAIRQALESQGVAAEIDAAVEQLLRSETDHQSATPPLMELLSTPGDRGQRTRAGRGKNPQPATPPRDPRPGLPERD